MPTYQDIYNRHQTAIAKGHIPADLPFEDYARQGAAATGDPSWLDVAEGGPVKNWIRTKNAQLNNVIESGPIDDWSEAAVGRIGDLFGITPATSRAVGKSLPRMTVDFLPMIAGGAVGGLVGSGAGPAGTAAGAATGAKIGMGLTSGLSALNAYGESGKGADALIAGASPYVASKLFGAGSAAATKWAGSSPLAKKIGLTGGQTTTRALTQAEQAGVTSLEKGGLGLTPEVAAATTMEEVTLQRAADRMFNYAAGLGAANMGFAGMDILRHGPDAVLNKDYLFSTLVSNLPFAGVDIHRLSRPQTISSKMNLPEAEKAYASEAEKRGYETALMFSGLDEPSVLKKYQEESLDLADFAKGVEEMNVAWEGRRRLYEELGPRYVEEWNQKATEWNAAVGANPLAGEPVPLIDLPSNVVRDFVRAPAGKDSAFPPQFQDLARKQLDALNAADNVFVNAKNGLKAIRSMTPKKLQEGYQRIADEFQLKDLFQKPVGERSVEDYQTALGKSMTLKGAELIRDFHRVAANEAPQSEAYREYLQMQTDAGKVAYSPDEQFELTVAHAIATGQLPDFNAAAKKMKNLQNAGATEAEVAAGGLNVIKPKGSGARKKLTPEEKALRRSAAKKRKQTIADVEKVKELSAFRQLIKDGVPENLTSEPKDDVPTHLLKAIQVMETMGKEKGWNQAQANDFVYAAMKEFKGGKGSYEVRFQKLLDLEAGVKAENQVRADAQFFDDVQNDAIEADGEVYHDEPTPDQFDEVVEKAEAELESEREVPKKVKAVQDKEERLTKPTTEEEAKATREQFKKSSYSTNQLEAIFNHPGFEELYRASRKNGAFEAAPYSREEAIKWFSSLGNQQFKAVVKPLTDMGLVLPKRALKYARLESNGDFVAIPDPEGPLMQVRAFADAIAGRMEWTNPVERERFVEDLPKLARLFVNPEVVYGELGVRTGEGLKMADGFYFRPAVKLGGKVVEAPLHLKAWEMQFNKPFERFGKMESEAMKGSLDKEGYVTPDGFMNRKEALKTFLARGGEMNLTPGETRDWLDSSDLKRAQALEDGKATGTIFGAASQKARQIYLNSPAFRALDSGAQKLIIFAHEHGHIADSKAANGEYGPEAKRLRDDSVAWGNLASPEAKQNVLEVMRDLGLPKGMDLKDIEGVFKNLETEEWMANAHAMFAVGALHSPHPKEMFAFLPKPMRNFLDWSVKTMQTLVKGVKTWAKLGFSVDKFQQVQRMEGYFDAVRRSFRQAEFDAAEAAKFLELQEPTMRQAQAEEFVLAQDRTGRPKAWTEPRAFFGTTWQKFVVGMGNLGRMYPVLQPAIDAVRKAGDSKSALTAHVMQVMYGKMDARSRVKVDTEGPLDHVAKSPPLRALFNEMHVQMQRENSNLLEMKEMPDGTIEMAFKDDAMTPEMRGRYKQFKPEAQKALLAAAANYQRSNIELQKTLVKAEEQGAYALVANVIFSLPSQKNKSGFEQAHQRATDLFQGLAAKDDMLIQKGLAGLSEEEAATALKQTQIYVESNQELAAFYQSRPSYMSLRRFKEFRQRITKGESRDVIDADSQTELNALLKKYTDKGWQLDGIVLRAKDKAQKEAFSVNDGVRDILERKEKRVKEFVESANIPDDVKADLLKQFDFVGELQHQVNAQNMYKPGANRQVVGDLSRFDVLEQFMHSVPASIAAASNAALNARVMFELRHPDLQMQRTQKDQFLALFEQSKKPDGKFVQELNRANAAWHIGLNFPGHIAEAFQPFMSHFPELKAQGLSTWQALSSLKKTFSEITNMYGLMVKEKIWKPQDMTVEINGKVYDGIPAAWYRANVKTLGKDNATEVMDMLADNISRIQRAPLQELFEVTGKEQRKLNDLMEGNRLQTMAEAIAAPVHKYEQTVMGLYSNFTQHNGLMALIPAYQQGRANGMTHEQAKLEAARFDLAVNNSGGKLERPEMFGEMGLAGHAVYALSSYVRGRFAQLATYYKHGWSEHFSGEAASLTPAQRANAKKAFQSMILMQLGFAGVLGLPFVGAGIALMEEMLDEDLKGKMLEGMNEALGDPILTRVASHGAASAFAESAGIPADLHSRFALSSFMGVNSYDGVSAKSFLGPMAAMVNSLWNMGGSLAKGEGVVNALAKGGPGGVKRFAEALTDQFRNENPKMNMFSSALGFRSADMVKRKEWEGIVRNQEIESSAKRKLAASEVAKAMKLGPGAARAKLMEEAVKLLPETKNPLERQEALKGIVQGLVQRVSMLSQDAVAPKDYRSVPSGAVLPQAMQTAAAMGMQQPAPMELARALAGQQARGMLGFKTSQSPMRAAAERQQKWNPFNAPF